jgi:hypothetical protein
LFGISWFIGKNNQQTNYSIVKKYNSRQLKGQLLARENNSIIRIDDLRYKVKSLSIKGEWYP